jgi:peroxiredoxin Q/BCP
VGRLWGGENRQVSPKPRPALFRALSALGLAALASCSAKAADLKPGDPAPDFALPGSDGRTHSLSALRGKAVVLAWFPKAFTSG